MNDTGDSKNHSRAPKQLGDFGEGLVTYALIRKGFELAVVDHVGADLIAERDPHRIAVSVKTRRYHSKSFESRDVVIEYEHLTKLRKFAQRFDLEPVFAFVVCIEADCIIHLFMLRVADIEQHLPKLKNGYSLKFSRKHLTQTISLPYVDYSSWSSESIGSKLFPLPEKQIGQVEAL